MKKRRILALLLSLIFATALLAGCGSGTATTGGSAVRISVHRRIRRRVFGRRDPCRRRTGQGHDDPVPRRHVRTDVRFP